VLCRSSAAPRFFRVKPIWFFSKKEKEKKTGEKKEKAEQRAAYAKTHQKLSLKRGRG